MSRRPTAHDTSRNDTTGIRHLRREPEAFRKRPVRIYPLCFTAESGPLGHRPQLFEIELVTGFGPDGFTRLKLAAELEVFNIHRLATVGAQMHFNPALGAVITNMMLKPGQVEIGVELAVDPDEKITVERRCDAEGIVI